MRKRVVEAHSAVGFSGGIMTVCGTLRHVSCEKSKPCADSSEGEWVGLAPHLDCTESFKFISRNLQTITRRFSEEQAKTPGVSDFLSVKC